MKVGFARVSTDKQELTNQLDDLAAANCDKIFHLKGSGTSKENDLKLAELCDFIRENDAVVVTKLNRLGRSTKKILEVIDVIHEKKAHVVALDRSIDTSNKNPFAVAMITLCSTFAQLDRDLIVERLSEGRAAAKAQGKSLGRPPTLNPQQVKDIGVLLKKKESIASIARRYDVTRTTIYSVRDKHFTKGNH